MPSPILPDGRRPHGPGDAWVDCACGSRHWGTHGAAGLLVADGVPPTRVVLQLRADWSHHGGTWGIPGGALQPDEAAVVGALRESAEEAGIDTAHVRPLATSVLTHADWSYTTVLARATTHLDPEPTDAESAAIAWVPLPEVADRELLPAFGEAWPTLRRMLETRPVLVVDAANVVGSKPDGWWRDRAGAASRLVADLDRLAGAGVPAALLGLPGDTWWPEVVAVTEGAARGVQGTDRVAVVEARGSGDDEIVAQVRRLRDGSGGARTTDGGPGTDVTVVTSDRELRRRVEALGARTVGAGSLPRP